MTMPTLIQNQRNKETVSQLKKAYSTLSQAALFAQNEYGDFGTWNIVDNNQASTREIFSYFEPYLKIIKKCDNKPGCWAKSTKSLTGQTAQYSGNEYLGVNFINFITADGMNIVFDFAPDSLRTYYGLPNEMTNKFIVFIVDVNGNKPPNTIGRDIFCFALSKTKLIPFGIEDNSKNCDKTIKNNYSGYGCTYKVLQEEAINY